MRNKTPLKGNKTMRNSYTITLDNTVFKVETAKNLYIMKKKDFNKYANISQPIIGVNNENN